jgi:5-methylcytosine-specific restriction protein A
MNTFLFTWNPFKWNWESLNENIELFDNGGKVTQWWSCVSYKTIKPGDRAFFMRLGSEPRGIFASGFIESDPYLSQHWSGEGKIGYRVQIDFDVLLHPEKDKILALEVLKSEDLNSQQWTPQSSGISIRPEVVKGLEKIWFEFLTTQNTRINFFAPTGFETVQTYIEGGASQILQTRYERNQHARTACLEMYGYSCSICKFDFEERFGDLGRGFIHVHHLTQLSTVGNRYEVNPVKDLRPVCPNCHAMLHRKNPPLTIEELKLRLT